MNGNNTLRRHQVRRVSVALNLAFLSTPAFALPALQDSASSNAQRVATESATASPPEPRSAAGDPAEPNPAASKRHDNQFEQSRIYFKRGVQLFDSRDYNAALTEFQRVYDAMAGHEKRYYVLDNIGMCHEKLFHYDLAIAYYERYLREAGCAAEDAASVLGIVHALKTLLGTLEIQSNVAAEVWVDNRLVGTAPGRISVPGGQHALELRSKGYQESKRAVQVASQETLVVNMMLESAQASQGLSPAYFWIALGSTVAAVGVGAGFGIAAKSEQTAALERARQYGDVVNTTADRDGIQRKARVADVLYGAAGLFAVGSGVLFFLTDFAGSDATQRAGSRPQNSFQFRASLDVTPHASLLVLKGSF